MKTYPECIPCMFEQLLRSARLADLTEEKTFDVIRSFSKKLAYSSFSLSPPEIAVQLYREIKRLSKNDDPFRAVKRENINKALALFDEMRKLIAESADKLDFALRVAAVGNIVDFGALKSFEISREMLDNLEINKLHWEIDELREDLRKSSILLIIGDNAGEAVFDRALIEAITRLYSIQKVYYAVRGAPVINDVTFDDATYAGVDSVAEIITTGSDVPGIVLNECSVQFVELFRTADVVISKGQGNFETLHGCERKVYFLLKVKCGVVAKITNAGIGDILLFSNKKAPAKGGL
ncbi:MAG TPA: DUF89 family protein [candidate division Zixibacteria bacterium]|nr:DUF89 family protein [candidate division Zixibacteria bacterium]